jgi:uncharacterized protein YcnI
MTRTGIFLAALLAGTGAASAHTTFAETEVRKGMAERLTLRVPHGCGAEATERLRVRIPAGMVSVKPMPKAGWELEVERGALDAPQQLNGSEITEGVRELTWIGNLPDGYYDEFVFQAVIAEGVEPGSTIYVPVVQECANGAERWIEIPAAGEHGNGHGLGYPAPSLKVVPGGMHHH